MISHLAIMVIFTVTMENELEKLPDIKDGRLSVYIPNENVPAS